MKLKRKSIKIKITIILISVIIALSFILNQNRKNNIIKANNIKSLKVLSDKYLNAGDINNALATSKEIVKFTKTNREQKDIDDLVKMKNLLNNIYTIENGNANLYDKNKQKVNKCNEILKIKKSTYFETVKDELETEIKYTEAQTKANDVKNNVISLIKQKKYEEAEKICYFDIGIEKGDSEIDAFWAYNHILMDEVKGDDMKESVLHFCVYISPNYHDAFATEIKNLVTKYITLAEWQKEHDMKLSVAEFIKKPEPSIGMTSEEVRASRWGDPEKINTTTTANGTSEQWVYSSGNYVYLDNGIVTTIQN